MFAMLVSSFWKLIKSYKFFSIIYVISVPLSYLKEDTILEAINTS